MKTDYKKLFETQTVWKSIFQMAVPSVMAILVMVFYNIADMFFIGQLGNTAMVAAVSLVGPIFTLIMGLATMIGAGGSALISNLIGAGNTEEARVNAAVAFAGSLFFGIAAGILVLIFENPLLHFLGVTSDTMQYARLYMDILAAGAPFAMIGTSLGLLTRAEGAVRQALVGNMAGTITNIILDPIFIMVLHFGVAGAAVATVLGNVVATVYFLNYIVRNGQILNLDLKLAIANMGHIGRIMELGLPNAISTLLSGFAGSFSNQLLSQYGTDAIAAMAAAGKTTMLIYMLQIGITMGCQPMIAYNYGARNVPRIREICQKVMLLDSMVGIASAIVCYMAKGPLVHLFLKQASAAGLAESLVIFMVLTAPLTGMVSLSTNFLQSSGNALQATILSVLNKGAVLIPMLYLMEHFFGLRGIAAAHPIADFISIGIAAVFFFRGYYRLKRSVESEVQAA